MPKIMILGGGNCQLSAAVRCRELGISTVLVDYTPQPPAAAYADIHEQISTFDAAACIAAARRHHIDGVLTLGTDQPVYTAALVAAALGLPAPLPPETAFAVTNKQRMKAVFDAAGIPSAPHRFLRRGASAAELAGLRPPFVIKPVDSQGQRGIALLPTAAEIIAHIDTTLSFSRSEYVLVEEYYPNAELTISGWVQGGKLHLLSVTDRLSHHLPPSIGVCYGHRCPSRHIAHYAEIERLSRRITTAFAIKEGPVYYQLLLGSEGLLVNEVAARIGGAFEDIFIPAVSGFAILDALIQQSLGATPDLHILTDYTPQHPHGAAGVLLLFCRSGRIASITPPAELLALPGVVAAGFQYRTGDSVPEIRDATARIGHCVLLAADGAELDARVEDFWQHFSVRSPAGEELALPCRL